MKTGLTRIFPVLAVAGLCLAIWFGGPLIAIADRQLLGPAWARAGAIVASVSIVTGYYLLHFLQAAKRQKALASLVTSSDDENSRALQARISDAVATLKRASAKRNFLSELPWYIIIGPPGTGKTTALINSGLNFPMTGSGEIQPVPGVGGTRHCDWWFAEDAVLIDTAGRYTTQDSDSRQDKKDWLTFLSLLKQHRGKRPINGIILATSVNDLMTLRSEDLAAHVIELRNRLAEIHEHLQVSVPIYVLFTKADLIAGFSAFFDCFDENRRRMVWGSTLGASGGNKENIARLATELEALAERLADEVTDRLNEEPDPVARMSIFGFPTQFTLLRERVLDFLEQVFGPEGKASGAVLRGFYFSSGTQEGTPFDQLLGAMGRDLGRDTSAHLSGTGKSFFLHDLLAKVIFPEGAAQAEAGPRRATLRYAVMALVFFAVAAPVVAWSISFMRNRSIIAATDQAVEQIRASTFAALGNASVTDSDLENVIGPLVALRDLPVGYENRVLPVSTLETFGLNQRERLQSTSETAYRVALERLLRPRLILQLEQTIRANMADPAKLYEPLKIYLMLGGKAPKVDDRLVTAWLEKDWEQNRFPGANNRAGREELRKHLQAMLDLDEAHEPLVDIDAALVEAAQRSLGRMTLPERAAAMIQSATYTADLDDFSIVSRGGPETPLVFETADGSDLSRLRVPGIYTYAGFNDFYLAQLAEIARKLSDEAWVIGAGSEQGVSAQEQLRLGPDLLDIYGKGFAAAWNEVLDHIRFRKMAADKPQYTALSAAALPTSPIKQLFEAVALETALTREADTTAPTGSADLSAGLAQIGIDTPTGKSQSRAGAAFANPNGLVPGAKVEVQFRPYQMMVSGPAGQRPIDALVRNFHDIYQSFLLAAAVPSQSERANVNLQLQISTLRANASRLPKPLARMVHAAADDFEGEAAETSLAKLNQMLVETVGGPCQEAIANRYPFAAGSAEDVPMADFVTMFAPNGVIDRFFTQYLAPFANLGGQDWEWRQETRLGQTLSKSTLRAFQKAAEIRDVFFEPGSTAPAIKISVTPASLHGDADMAVLDVNGQLVQSYQSGNTPSEISWPDTISAGSASISLTPELPGRDSAISFKGPWALKRLLDAGAVTRNGERTEARFVIGGRDVAYSIATESGSDPFELPALAGFSCPISLR